MVHQLMRKKTIRNLCKIGQNFNPGICYVRKKVSQYNDTESKKKSQNN